jgi:hypothetical protein
VRRAERASADDRATSDGAARQRVTTERGSTSAPGASDRSIRRRGNSDAVSPGSSAPHSDESRPSSQWPSSARLSSSERAPAVPALDPLATSNVEIDPGANEEFDPDVLLDIDEALAAVDENAFAMLFKKEQVLVDGELVRKEKFAHPDNCHRWRGLRRRGYAPKSVLGKQIDAGALVRCGSLEFLAKARPSRSTHVRKLLAGAGPSGLPAIVASAPSPLARQARDRAVARGATLAEFLPSARTIPSELPGRLTIAEPSSESSIILNAEAWGDIDGDGTEDLVLSILNTADDGTDYDMRLIHVTRLSPSSPLSVLAVVE